MGLRGDLEVIKDAVKRGVAQYDLLNSQKAEAEDNLEIIVEKLVVTEKARAFLQLQAETAQREVAETLSVIITSAIQSVFSSEYECSISFETKRNQTEAALVISKGDDIIEDPINAVGGGLIDIAAFAARVAFIFLSGARKVFVADEPFRCVSADLRDKIPEMLKLLSDRLGMQFIIVSHLPELVSGADTVIKLKNGEIVQ